MIDNLATCVEPYIQARPCEQDLTICYYCQGQKEVLDMNDLVKAADSSTRVLAAAIRRASDVTQLASQASMLQYTFVLSAR